jgi:hypothetical protein
MLPYLPLRLKLRAEATVNKARLRQLNLLEEKTNQLLPKEIQLEALDLLVELLNSVIPALVEETNNEQDHE